MDPKATAKSKRIHTQHGRRAHLPPPAIAHKKKAAAVASASATSTHRPLPSNWDRYDDSNDETDPNLVANLSDHGEIKPKSKGADFGYLIEQARSQPKDLGYHGSQGSSSVDDFSFDFMQGVSSLLSVRGKGLLSLCQDDNFIVDDDTISGSEAPFLSMDLHALSAQLSRLKLSQRLFIEADLLLEELNAEEHTTTSAPTKPEISESAADSDYGFDPHDLCSFPVLENDGQTGINSNFKVNLVAGSEKDKSHISPVNSPELEELSSSSKQTDWFGRREVEEPILQTTAGVVSKSEQKKSGRFAAATAEAELDMLLDSFSETNLSGSTPVSLLIDKSSVQKSSNFGSIVPQGGQSSQDPDSSTNAMTTSIDDSIDDLLAETSLCLDDHKQTAMQQKQKNFPEISPLGSRSTNAYGSLDDSIDDLLAEASLSLKEHTQAENQQNKGTTSKVMDDFDSWLDTL